MILRSVLLTMAALAVLAVSSPSAAQTAPQPIIIGQTYQVVTPEYPRPRGVSVWLPPGYETSGKSYPVLYLLDGGPDQDFHHITGIFQVGGMNGVTRDAIVIGVASVDRRNELALPTRNAELIQQYPTQGDSARFRRFLTGTVQPWAREHYRTDGTEVLMGESLAGLFVVETALKSPQAFDAYVAVSPSLWWDDGELAGQAGELLASHPGTQARLMLFLGNEGELMQASMDRLVASLTAHAPAGLTWSYEPRSAETHASIYPGAALTAVRTLFPAEASH